MPFPSWSATPRISASDSPNAELVFCLLPLLFVVMNQEDLDSRFLQGIEYFNDCEFFEAHEVWEDLWAGCQDDSRKFYQGLIQAAVCLHHFGNGNIRGARKLYETCRYRYLNEYRSWHMGIDLDGFLLQLQTCCQSILDSDEEFPNIEINPELIPEIHLVPRPDGR